ncbi:indolepyruvate oxidoreductase subunit beta family protein [Arenicella xantha]|uniref:Indolepyruvate ferredoxin oxidoreductase beta subunit n=1 Tax=Arenicella xantha TaxID=644221 RepID=A0A395JPL7_9GAMM|nr:indolepyruvate oxidoreductase subunit beta family protein [Arenicella xantha]RBP53549.1 indolepyruvate ferredoxin oxidoreductase beta subunit [Arenicella xantha]
MTNTTKQPIKLAIAAMGGQGGGVLSAWMVALAESNQYYAQYTSVPGVAQRTGSTIYYIELFPEELSKQAAKEPVMALMPVEGDVDIVVAGELVEAGRAVTRGLVTPEQTTFIVSTHRLYSQAEKEVLGDGRANSELIIAGAREHAKNFIGFDMQQTAIDTGCMISAILFGSLAGSNQLPFEREQFEQVIRQGGKAVESNLAGFNAGYARAQALLNNTHAVSDSTSSAQEFRFPTATQPKLQALLNTIKSVLPEQAHEFAVEGIKRLVDYQDIAYADEYLQQLIKVLDTDLANGGESQQFALTREVARYLALWMSYEDTIRVADLKIRQQRFTRYKDHVKAKPGDVVHVVEFMHPRLEEIADTMPSWFGNMILNVAPLRAMVSYFCKERKINTSKLGGFLMLYVTAKFRGIRRSTLRFKREHTRIDDWLNLVASTASSDYQSGVSLAQCQRLIKGYGDTHERGWANYSSIVASLPKIMSKSEPSQVITRLRDAALAEESGAQLNSEMSSAVAG